MGVLAIAVASSMFGGQMTPVRAGSELVHPTRLLVSSVTHESLNREVGRVKARILAEYPEIGYTVVEAAPGTLQWTKRELEDTTTGRVEFDVARRVGYNPNDTLWPDMWHYRTLKVDLAWDIGFGSSIPVAVIDTGVNIGHPDLAANIWVNSDEVPGNAVDDDGNGYIDDVNGWDFNANDPIANDFHGHGTACAGLVAAVQDNALGVTGVAPRAKIMALKASTDEGYFYASQNIGSLLYAANNGAKVLSMSFFGDGIIPGEAVAIKYCWDNGVLPVAAAGNDNTVWAYYPAAYEETLAVAATNTSNNKASFSNWGSWVDIAAPGVQLRTTSGSNSYTSGFGGTSGACPQVAGIAALIWGQRPSWTAQDIRRVLEDSATPMVQAPFGEYVNYGMANAQAAMQHANAGSFPVARQALVRWMSPTTVLSSTQKVVRGQTARIYGRGFQLPRAVVVRQGPKVLQLVAQTRDYLDVVLQPGRNPITVFVDGVLIKTISSEPSTSNQLPMIEASTDGATLEGGFFETLKADGSELRCTRRNDNSILVEATFRKAPVAAKGDWYLVLKRRYVGATAGTENIQLYNWSSASLPYGTWDTKRSQSVATFPNSVQTIPVGPLASYVDDQGTIYFRLTSSGVTGGSPELFVDQLYLARNP